MYPYSVQHTLPRGGMYLALHSDSRQYTAILENMMSADHIINVASEYQEIHP